VKNAERIVGGDRYSRNIAVNQKFNNEFSPGICVASGETFPDALSGSSYVLTGFFMNLNEVNHPRHTAPQLSSRRNIRLV
jgi:Putative cell wall binding repeat 2.